MTIDFQRERRSTAAPMDFEFTSPNRELPVDSPFRHGIDAAAAAKRVLKLALTDLSRSCVPGSRMEMESPASTSYSFGNSHSSVPFLFNIPTPSTQAPSWSPPDVQDIQMEEASQGESDKPRPILRGAMRRVYKSRRRGKNPGKDYSTESESDDDAIVGRSVKSPTTAFSNHYTLNIGRNGKPTSSNAPYVLIG